MSMKRKGSNSPKKKEQERKRLPSPQTPNLLFKPNDTFSTDCTNVSNEKTGKLRDKFIGQEPLTSTDYFSSSNTVINNYYIYPPYFQVELDRLERSFPKNFPHPEIPMAPLSDFNVDWVSSGLTKLTSLSNENKSSHTMNPPCKDDRQENTCSKKSITSHYMKFINGAWEYVNYPDIPNESIGKCYYRKSRFVDTYQKDIDSRMEKQRIGSNIKSSNILRSKKEVIQDEWQILRSPDNSAANVEPSQTGSREKLVSDRGSSNNFLNAAKNSKPVEIPCGYEDDPSLPDYAKVPGILKCKDDSIWKKLWEP
ncbi:uncharacterized protein LOC115230355 [Octopus sinensis]|uniref:Uncharacterized protein LOC115230355 n=1 Tax=Octopus sinensis TaxID=2607531 RepID=A0A6P7U2C8_9MOLL|nr:uncharacterized protein LOC115230355 [Octopus sinensis]